MAFTFSLIKDRERTVALPTLPCSTVYTSNRDEYGYEVTPSEVCDCSVCDQSCKPIDWTHIIRKTSVFDGFQLQTVSLMLFLVSVIVLTSFWTAHRKKVKDRKVELYSSFDSYDSIKKYL